MAVVSPASNAMSRLQRSSFRRHGRILARSAQGIWRIELGVVRTVTWSEEGQLIALGYWGPGDIVGQSLSRLYPYEIECTTDVAASFLSAYRLPEAVEAILSHAQQVEELLCIAHCSQVRDRLLQWLGWLARKFGEETEQGRRIALKLTHQELAEAARTTRVTVTRLLQELEQDGLIYRPARHCVVLRQDGSRS